MKLRRPVAECNGASRLPEDRAGEGQSEPKGAERDSWLRAIFLTTGWPAPAESTAEPERDR